MKFYVVDNGSRHINEIINRVRSKGHDYVVEKQWPGLVLDPQNADYIILSGGMQNEVVDVNFDRQPWFANEFELIRKTDKPILGICLGLQMIVVALGGSLKTLPKIIEEDKTIELTPELTKRLDASIIKVREAHRWVADNLEKTELELLLESNDGPELLVSRTRNIVATQFHPEVDIKGFDSEGLFWHIVELAKVESFSV